MKAKSAAKALGKLIDDEKFMKKVYEQAHGNCNNVYHILGNALSFIILTNGQAKISEPCRDLYEYALKNGVNLSDPKVQEQCKKNVFENPLMTHSFNGRNYKMAKKYGLGTEKSYDSKLSECLTDLEEKLGKSIFLDKQTNTTSELYFCSPGVKSFYYACMQSPERLYLGILNQDRDNALPVIVGEKKEEYMLRVVYDKINRLYKIDEQEILRKEAEYVVSSFCSKRPVISLFPAESKKYELNVAHATMMNGTQSVSERIQNNVGDDFLRYFTEKSEEAETNNLGNLVSVDTAIPSSELGFVEVPDQFEMMQKFAELRGLKKGDKIDYFTGEKYVEKEDVAEEKHEIVENKVVNEKSPKVQIAEKGREL